jgi:hypothetical protein
MRRVAIVAACVAAVPGAVLAIADGAMAFGCFKANRDVWQDQYVACHGSVCDGNHDQWLLPILDTSEGIFCYHTGDTSLWPPARCMACGQTLDAWLLNAFWNHSTPTGDWYHFFYWGSLDKVRDPVLGASQEWTVTYRPDACPDMHGAYVVGDDHEWQDFNPGIDFKLPRMRLELVLRDRAWRLGAELGPEWDELGRWARRMIVFEEVAGVYQSPATAPGAHYADLPVGVTVSDYWERAIALAWQFWIYETGSDGEYTLMRDRPEMAGYAPIATGIPDRTIADWQDMQDIIDETYALFGEVLTPVEPSTWGRIKHRYGGPERR